MEESKVVRLHGFWSSAYVYRVIWALKLKGTVAYEYIEEDLSNKSTDLLQYNPVYKKVPVLVHGGKAVVESAVILQYIEETWPDDQNPLLPSDAYERAIARFWIDFGQQKNDIFLALLPSPEKDKEKAVKQVMETLKIIEDEALGDKKFFGGNKIGLVDLSFGWIATNWFECVQEIVGVRILEPNTLPRLCQWAMNFRQEHAIKENLPDTKELLRLFKLLKENRKKITSHN